MKQEFYKLQIKTKGQKLYEFTNDTIHWIGQNKLKNVPNKFIHKPWEMELKYQEAIKTIIGKDYPGPIVVHEKARAAALQAFQSLKKK